MTRAKSAKTVPPEAPAAVAAPGAAPARTSAPQAPPRKAVAVRRVPQQARSQQTVQAVLRAAGEEIERSGLDNLSTKRVAATAGLSVGALYGYFPNKESIIAALLEAWLGRVFEAVDSVHPRHGEATDLFGYLRLQVDRAEAVYTHQPGLSALFTMSMAIPSLHQMLLAHGERVASSVESGLAHFAPRAPHEAVASVAATIPLVCHELLASMTLNPHTDRSRMRRNLSLCLVALGTDLLAA